MPNYLQTSQVSRKCTQQPTKTSSTTWCTASQYWASLRSSTSFEHQSRPKQSERNRLETSSILFHGQKLRSRTSATLSLILNGEVSASLISPSSFGLFGMQVQHQTSTHAGNILSSSSVCYLHVLTKAQRKMGIAKKNLAKALDDYLAKGDSLEDPFSKQTLRNYQPCVSTPKTPEHHKERVNQKNTVNHNSCPRFLSYNLGGTSHEQQWHPSSYACSTLAVSLKRWDVEAGTIKRTSQRNKGMAEWHTKSLV